MYEVNGFIFESEELAEKAKKEADGIKYIKSQTRMDNPDVVFDLYNKILQKKMFDTPVGIGFLVELQEYLKTVPYIDNDDISPIPVKPGVVIRQEKQAKIERVKPAAKRSASSSFFMFTTFVLALIVVGMFVITYLSKDNSNIINYENEIINKYEVWENQLKEKETQLKEREKAIEEKEAMLGEIVENGED